MRLSNEWKLFLTFFITYALFANYVNWNENSRIDLTMSIYEHQTFSIDNYFNNTGDRAFYDGHYYSDKEPGMSFLALPSYAVYRLFAPEPKVHNNLELQDVSRSFLTVILLAIITTSALAGAATVVLVYRTLKMHASKQALLLSVAFGAGTFVLLYSRLFMNHTVAMFFSFFSYYLILKRRPLLSGIMAGLAVLTQVSAGAVVLALFVYICFKRREHVLHYLGGLSLGLIPFLIYNTVIFHNPFELTYFHMDEEIWGEDFKQFEPRYFSALNIGLRLLIYPYRGIFFYSPFLILAIPGIISLYKKKKADAVLISSIFLTYLIYNTQLSVWFGGSSFGARHLVITIPFLVIAVSNCRMDKRFLYILVMISIMLNFLGVQYIRDKSYIVDDEFYDRLNTFRPVANPIFKHYIPQFVRHGPDSGLLYSVLGINLPAFANLLLLSAALYLIWKN